MVQEEQRRASQISTAHSLTAKMNHPRDSALGPFEMATIPVPKGRPSHFRPLTLERALSGKFAVNRLSALRPSQLWRVQQYDPQLNALETPLPDDSKTMDGMMTLERFDSAQSDWFGFMEDLQEYAQSQGLTSNQ